MRKLLFCFITTVSFATCLVSCGHGTVSKADADSTTTVTDSVVEDSLAVVSADSVK